MSSNKTKNTYIIDLPDYAPEEVIEWFKFLSDHNELAGELVSLVHNHIKCQSSLVKVNASSTVETKKQNTNKPMDSKSFFDDLYNWKDSYGNLFTK